LVRGNKPDAVPKKFEFTIEAPSKKDAKDYARKATTKKLTDRGTPPHPQPYPDGTEGWNIGHCDCIPVK
jgi:hypothetical protein